MNPLVLVVEDDASYRRLLTVNLQLEGLDVIAAADAGEARDLMQRHLPDLVLLDLTLPDIGGLALLRQLRADPIWSSSSVVILTVTDAVDIRIAGLDAGADDFLIKQRADFPEIVARIRSHLRRMERERKWAQLLPLRPRESNSTALTPREKEILWAIGRGAQTPEIARLLGMSRHTVRTHVEHLLAKLGARTRAEAFGIAVHRGLVALSRPGETSVATTKQDT